MSAPGVPVRYDVPEPDAFTRTYWNAAAQGRLLLRRCGACGRAHHYPREFCPHCWSENVTWEAASGRATLYTWSVVHRNDLPPFGGRTPYVAAVVDLAEGPRMMTEIVECAQEELRAGMELEAAFRGGVDAVLGAAESVGAVESVESMGTSGTGMAAVDAKAPQRRGASPDATAPQPGGASPDATAPQPRGASPEATAIQPGTAVPDLTSAPQPPSPGAAAPGTTSLQLAGASRDGAPVVPVFRPRRGR